jgi:ABC-type uncharacterized transport system permease subunit
MSTASPPALRRRLRLPPILLAIAIGIVTGGLLILVFGGDPVAAYTQLVLGALSPDALPDTLDWAVPLVGMTIAAAIPLRGGMVNLGGDGQLVVGGLVAALAAVYVPAPGPVMQVLAPILAMAAAGLYAVLAAWGEIRHGVPMLISSLLLSYPAMGAASYLVSFPLRDTSSGLPQTRIVPEGVRLPTFDGRLSVGILAVAAVVVAFVWVDRRTAAGYELRMRGLNPRFAAYGGVRLRSQAVGAMFASGAVAGLVGALIVLGSQFRFTDGALLSPNYTWSGLMAALLAGGEPLGAAAAGLFFAALQTGGFAMQRETAVPRVLAMVLQAVIILVLAVRHGLGRRPA